MFWPILVRIGMKLFSIFLVLLSGCSILDIKEKGVEIKTEPKTVSVDLKPTTTLEVKPGAIQLSIPDALRISPSIGVSSNAVVLNVPKDVVHFEVSPNAFNLTLPDAMKIAPVLNIQPGAVSIPVPKDMIHIEVAQGAIQVSIAPNTSVAKDAVDLFWVGAAIVISTLLGLGGYWLLHRRLSSVERTLSREMRKDKNE